MLGRVLVILTSANSITLKNGDRQPTGYDQFAFVEVVDALKNEGFLIDIGTLGGHTPFQDAACLNHLSNSDKRYYKQYMESEPLMLLPKNITHISEEELQHYVAVFFPGGYSALDELCSAPDILKVLKHFHHYMKPIGIIGTGTAALIHNEIPWLFTGYRIACPNLDVETEYETLILPADLPFHVGYILEQLGARTTFSQPMETHIIEHNELITAQNKYSAFDFAKQFALKIKYDLKLNQ